MLVRVAPVGVVICIAWVAMLIVSKVIDKDKTASNLYRQLKAKKKELLQLNSQLKR